MNNQPKRDNIKKILTVYLKEIHKIFTDGNFREESFYPSLKNLFEQCAQFIGNPAGVLVQPKRTDVGIPDFLIKKDGEIIGYIEAKTPDTNLRDIEDFEQIKRYQTSLPNLILTNFLEFRLYRNGEPVDNVEMGRQFTLQVLKFPPTPENLESFLEFLTKFFSFSMPEIKNSSNLSTELAKRTRFLEHILTEEISKGNDEVLKFYNAFKTELIETLTTERFSDLYAQTITYGLFAARMRVQNGFKKELSWQFIPESLPLLKEIFYSFTGPSLPESLSWIVDDLSQTLEKADVSSILNEFKTTRWEDDPVIHFYETFLTTYNPKERKGLGVYYTPLPVVSYIVKSIHNLLKDKFNKTDGLATRDVTLLDPSAGTLTFVVQAIKLVLNELKERKREGLIKSYVEEHIIPHFYAFEILMAPYTVGHFKVSLVLEEMGYKFKNEERFQFYLTNTLEIKEPKQTTFLINLAKEGEEAKRIKEKVPILVVLGNPPYSVSSENKSTFIETLMNDYKEDVRNERNLQPLSDDYIKFIRFAHWKIAQAGQGILGFITNNSYLSGVIHRGMRKKLMQTFDEVYILNLHGSSRIGEVTPQGGKDGNVFDIQQGVSIALYVKFEKAQKKKMVYYSDLWGIREKKYKYLMSNDYQTTKWKRLKPVEPYYFFVPKEFSLQKEYEKFWKVTEIFKEYSSGVQTKRDELAVNFDRNILQKNFLMFQNLSLSDEIIKKTFKITDTYEWNLRQARERVNKEGINEMIKCYLYRPFDKRWIYYSDAILARRFIRVMKHLFKENVAISTSRKYPGTRNFGALVTNLIGDIHVVADQTYFFPLYLYGKRDNPKKRFLSSQLMLFEPEIDYDGKKSNLSEAFVEQLAKSFKKTPSPEEIFYYIYAVLYSNTYREKYAEFLKIDFPRIPLPTDSKSFKKMSELGKELMELHLLRHPILNKTDIGFPQKDSDKVEKVYYDEETKKVYINKTQYFEGVQKDIWTYQIGGYQVMEKYLKDRKGRRLSLDEKEHYMKIEKVISHTINLQTKIDNVYKEIG